MSSLDGWLLVIVILGFAFAFFYNKLDNKVSALKQDIADLQKQLTLVQHSVRQLERSARASVDKLAQNPLEPPVSQHLKQSPSQSPKYIDDTVKKTQTSGQDHVPDWKPDSTAQAFKPTPPSDIPATDNDFLNSSVDVTIIADSSAPQSKPTSKPVTKPFPTAKAIPAKTIPTKATPVAKPVATPRPTAQATIANKSTRKPSLAEPDERSIPIVTSLFESAKNWFLGGNLVVRVGVIVLLMGVVLLLRLLSDYIEIPIEVKLFAIGIVGLGLAGLGLKLVKKRFTYGITLQGAGLAIAYLSTFFAYRVYHVLPSFPSFVLLGVLSLITVGLAVRQNAFPLALLAFSGAFLAPVLTSDDTGSLTALFGYYLLLNVGIAVIAHYRTWKVLNLLGASVTFGLAYYWGFSGILSDEVEGQRWSLSVIVGMHWLLYLFVAIRYAQQILAYNETITTTDMLDEVDVMGRKVLFPIDTGLMFATPLLAFGLMSALLHDVEHALSVVSAIMATTYIVVGWMLIKRNRHHALLSEGLLALGFGFLALIVPLELDAQWVSFGWSIQGLALVWFGRRSLRAWAVIFGIILQTIAIVALLPDAIQFYDSNASLLALAISAISFMASMFVLRDANSPIDAASPQDKALLPFVYNQSMAFNLVWRTPPLAVILTLGGMLWTVLITASLLNWADARIGSDTLTDAGFVSFIMLSNMTIYWLINRYRYWEEVSWFTHGLFAVYCISLIVLLPESYTVRSIEDINNLGINWFEFLPLLLGWLIVGQLWIKEWVQDYQNSYEDTAQNSHQNTTLNNTENNTKTVSKISILLDYIQPTLWLGGIVIIIAQLAHYLLPDSHEVMTVIITSVSLLAIITLAKRVLIGITPWFNWRGALMGTGILFVPIILGWAVISNVYHDGMVWGLPYIPVFNLYDFAILLALAYGASLYPVYANKTQAQGKPSGAMLWAIAGSCGGVGVWIISSILVRTLHTYAHTPLWIDGAILDDKVQICLTIFWSVVLLFSAYKLPRILPSFDWNKAVITSSYLFIPLMLGWAVISNSYHDGVVWGLPYIPILNLYDIAILLALAYGASVYRIYVNDDVNHARTSDMQRNIMLYGLGGIGIWIISSILVRILHAYAGSPLWVDGALLNDKVQICLTIFWSVTLLFTAYKLPRIKPAFDWHKAIVASSYVFIPFMFVWIILSNWHYDGVVWGLPYIPVLNLYDIAIFLALAYGLKIHQLTANYINGMPDNYSDNYSNSYFGGYKNILLKVIGIIGFWVLSSILVRTLHTYVGTPLWSEGAWGSDKVQTGLTILWTLTALVATVMSSRNGKRFWWFMGVGLLGAVVLKLVLVDLSQTSSILRVVSFIGAGGLMMLIGYLAPLPPEEGELDEEYIEDKESIEHDKD